MIIIIIKIQPLNVISDPIRYHIIDLIGNHFREMPSALINLPIGLIWANLAELAVLVAMVLSSKVISELISDWISHRIGDYITGKTPDLITYHF